MKEVPAERTNVLVVIIEKGSYLPRGAEIQRPKQRRKCDSKIEPVCTIDSCAELESKMCIMIS